jgi:hypothetical protein
MENDYQFLAYAFFKGEISEADLDILIDWLMKSEENKNEFLQVRNLYLAELHELKKENLKQTASEQWKKLLVKLKQNDATGNKPKAKVIQIFTNKRLLQIAAVWGGAIVFVSILFWLIKKDYWNKEQNIVNNAAYKKANSVFSLQQKAVLTLSNGQTVLLDSLQNKLIATDANAELSNKNGTIKYKSISQDETSVVYNTISTTKGGQYKLVLADGTNVWLNTLSSLTYPVTFHGKERIVKLTGEAYFEVAKNTQMPFKVSINNQMIEVLGTHFNVNGYSNESSMNTTLLEGKVKVTTNKEVLELRPGQQSKVNVNGNIKLELNADITRVMAWRDGVLSFNNSAIGDIIHQLERWFDFDVKIQGDFSDRRFSGNIPRTISLKELQKLFEANRISCVLFNNVGTAQTLIISPLNPNRNK